MELTELRNKLRGVKGNEKKFTALCPAHEDKNNSLSIEIKADKIMVHCFAGCTTEAIMESLGLEMADLFVGKTAAKRIVKTYDYTDEQGKLLFQVCRFQPKSFMQRHTNGDGTWTYSMKGVRRVLYHLHDIIKAPKLYFVEGEKDCDALWDCGFVATTSPGGAKNWRPEYAECLKGKKIVLIPDNDDAGYSYARDVASSLMEKCELSCVLLKSKDVSDWLTNGGLPDQLAEMEQDVTLLWNRDKPQYTLLPEGAIIWRHKDLVFKAEAIRHERTGIHGRVSIEHNYSPLAWSVFNLERVEERTRLSKQAHAQLKPTIKQTYPEADLKRDFDVFCAGLWDFYLSHYTPELIYGVETPQPLKFALRPYIMWGGGTIIFAAPGKGKSYSGLLWAQSINCGVDTFWPVEQAPVLYINLERSKDTIQRRLSCINRVLGLPATEPLRVINARGKSLLDVLPICQRTVKQHNIKVIVLDSISRAGYGDLAENRPINAIIDGLSSLCDTWLALGHTPRADESHVYGSIMFEAGADIVIRLSSEESNPTTLGVGYEITKSNDLRGVSQMIWAMEFDDNGIVLLRKAKPFEFPEVAGKAKKPMIQAIKDYIQEQDAAQATASELADALNLNRGNISNLLRTSGQFVQTKKDGRNVYYGIKESTE
jgi:hypothetical protein